MSSFFGCFARGFEKSVSGGSCKPTGLAGLLAMLLICAGGLQSAAAATMDATLIEDTYLQSPQDVNYSSEAVLKFRTFRSVWRNPLIQFDLPALPSGQRVVGAELILTSAQAVSGVGGTPDIEVLATTTPIDLSSATYVTTDPALHTGGEPGVSALLWTNAWSDFSTESVIPGADFSSGQIVVYADNDGADGMLKFVRDSISGTNPVTVNFGLGFVSREGEGGTTSAGWDIHSGESAGNAPILRITTEAIPEPSGISLALFAGLLLPRSRQLRSTYS
ncbi:hypothetical protein [Adhaeretor mobilis]|uniref:Uncharacterized protein n=1 Tax=Adhaeretor mobilis TaxID=1930276 RepID=A0A517MW53_9BACT|nr:hypothetical protein [Adhaeretor mobilis]QDS99099.1 hypothetical protein HG15A2_23890 [Adhaeretor mobilis]